MQKRRLWFENQSRQKWRPKQSAGEVARVDKERRELRSSSETTKELSHKNVRNVSWTSEMSVGRQKNIKNVSWTSEMSVGRQKKYQKCQLDVRNVSWTSEYYILEYGEDITSVSRARKGS